ncbi:MAG: lanthionine synthetase LanC family protein [Candidatus Promineifilaceae bacterium]
MSTLDDALVLPDDVALVPVMEYPEQTRAQFSYEPGDVAITRVRSRTPTKIIDADLASLLELFSSEKTVVEAVLYHSVRESVDPRELLNEAYPVILQMVAERLLVPARPKELDPAAKLDLGERVDEFKVVRTIRSLLDSDLYQVRDEDGSLFALKLARPHESRSIAQALQHEAAVLQYLDAFLSPRFATQGLFNDQPYLVSEWRPGIDASAAAAELRGQPNLSASRDLLKLAVSILTAYAELHEHGVLHGDVHPGNIIVDIDGSVSLIDFGLARIFDKNAGLQEPNPGGVAFFATPEYCRALLKQQRPPLATMQGEQYALAALIYHLFAGAHYLNFSLEEEVMWQQIAGDDPLPFDHHQAGSWPEVEKVVGKALSKQPEDRYVSTKEFAAALGNAAAGNWIDDPPRFDLPLINNGAGEHLVEDVIKRLGWEIRVLEDGKIRAPTASVNYGAAGIAYFLYRAACTRDDPKLLALADVWATRAEQLAKDEDGFQNVEIEVMLETVHDISPLHSASGLHIIRFLLAQAVGDEMTQAAALTNFVNAAGKACDDLDLTLGISSVLLHSAYLYELLPQSNWAEQSGLYDLGQRSMEQIWRQLESYAPISRDAELTNLGIAHGWAGILFGTLQWCNITGAPLPATFRQRAEQLAAHYEYVGRGIEMPWDLSFPMPSTMAGWCNGSAGHLFLWTALYRMLGDERYLTLAVRSGWNVWEAPRSTVNLCCGLAGRAYALLNLYRHTGDVHWLERAAELGRQAAVNSRRPQTGDFEGFENSLYKGDVGVAALLIDLEDPQHAAMPFFESLKHD